MRATRARLNRLSEIFAGIGHVALASVALPALLDKYNPTMIAWGIVTALVFWIASLLLAR